MDIAGVDTTRHRGKLMLFTPAYHAHTDTARGGLEWVVRGNPLRLAGAPQAAGKTPIPRDGFVLSYGGSTAPPPLSALTHGTRVELETTYASLDAPNESGREPTRSWAARPADSRWPDLTEWGPEKLAASSCKRGTRAP